MTTKEERRLKIKAGVRGKISGTPERPRLTVFRSNKQIYAQVIDDTTGKTLAAASSLKMDVKAPKKEIAAKVGEQIAKVAHEMRQGNQKTNHRPDCRPHYGAARTDKIAVVGTRGAWQKGRACQAAGGCKKERLCACARGWNFV